MGLHAKKESVLIITALFLLTIIFSVNVNAQSPSQNVCCILPDGECEFVQGQTTQSYCLSQNGIFNDTHSCMSIDKCNTEVCCKLAGGNLYWADSESVCTVDGVVEDLDREHCDDNTDSTVQIYGTVVYSDNNIPAESATVTVYDFETKVVVKTDNVDKEGKYSLTVPKSKKYNIIVTLTSSCSYTSSAFDVLNSNYDAGQYKLPCTSPNRCMTHWRALEWQSNAGTCGKREVIPDNNCPTITLDNKPAEYLACTDAVCGNEVFENGEQCDIVSGASVFPADKDSCSERFGSNSFGSVSCSDQCQIIYNCVECVGACDDSRKCTHCPNLCENNMLCEDRCSEDKDKVTDFAVDGAYKNGLKGFALSWNVPNYCQTSTIKISRCKADNDATPTKCATALEEIKTLAGTEASYSDFSISQTGKAYCYNISVSGRTIFSDYTISSSKIECETVWDEECFNNPDESVCIDDELVSCIKGKVQNRDTCTCGCRDKTISTAAACIIETEECNICDVCSGPFGVYSHINYYLADITAYSEMFTYCETDLLSSYGDEKYCYRDEYSFVNTNVGQYKACGNVSDCYDYRTKTSCLTNPCGISSIAESNCDWHSLTPNNELGLGVCVPKDTEEQDCTKCNEEGMLGNYCSKEMCMLYGNGSTCYYNTNKSYIYRKLVIDNASCMNVRDVTCETYDSETECIGSNQKNFSANIIRDSRGDITGGTHTYSVSNDTFKLGKCKWVQVSGSNKCIRDADMSVLGTDIKSDCDRTDAEPENINCFKDFTNPHTKLYVLDNEMQNGTEYSLDELEKLTVQIEENNGEQTFLSVSSTDAFVYPAVNYNELITMIGTLRQIANGLSVPKNITIYFFSKDKSSNMEIVKGHKISLLPRLANTTTLEYPVTSSYDEAHDEYLSNLTVKIKNTDELHCEVSLQNRFALSETYGADATKSGTDLVWVYESLLDGSYNLIVKCADEHLQVFNKNVVVSVDADKSIHNALPRGAAFRQGTVTLTMSTNDTANCYYLTNTNGNLVGLNTNLPPSSNNPSDAWKVFEATSAGKIHTATVTENVDGLKYYYPACYFQSYQSWTKFSSGDIMYFSIDNRAPIVTVRSDTGQIYNYEKANATELLTLKAYCNDNDTIYDVGNGSRKKNYAFGCSELITVDIYHSTLNSQGVKVDAKISSVQRQNGDPIIITAPEEYRAIYLNITAKDKGGNTNTYTQWVNVRNLSFLNPLIQICDPETTECS